MKDNPEDESIEPVQLDLDLIKKQIPNYTSVKLCEMIACNRYLGFEKRVAIMCMEELSDRRLKGDNFDFETHIEECISSLPPLNFNLPNLRDVLHQAIKSK